MIFVIILITFIFMLVKGSSNERNRLIDDEEQMKAISEMRKKCDGKNLKE